MRNARTARWAAHWRILGSRRNPERRLGVWAFALPVVQIEQHCRALRRRQQQVLKLSQHVRTNDIPFVRGNQVVVRALPDKNVEVVEPEIGEDLFQLPVTVNRAQQLRRLHFIVDYAYRVIERQYSFALLGSEASEERLPFVEAEALRQVALLRNR